MLLRKELDRCSKFKLWKFWERPLYEISEYASTILLGTGAWRGLSNGGFCRSNGFTPKMRTFLPTIHPYFPSTMHHFGDQQYILRNYFALYTGAWWLGYLIGGFPMVVLIIPMFFFPRTMSPKEHAPEMTSNENGIKERQLIENENRDIIDVVRTGAEKVGFVEVVRGKFLCTQKWYCAWDFRHDELRFWTTGVNRLHAFQTLVHVLWYGIAINRMEPTV